MATQRKRYSAAEVDAIVSDQEYRNCVFDGLLLLRKSLENCRFTACSFARTDLTDARLNASTFRSCNFAGAVVAGCNCFSTDFEDCKLLGLDFSRGRQLMAARLARCNLDVGEY